MWQWDQRPWNDFELYSRQMSYMQDVWACMNFSSVNHRNILNPDAHPDAHIKAGGDVVGSLENKSV